MKSIANKINVVSTEADALSLVANKLNSNGIKVISFINAHAYTLIDSSKDFENSIMNSDIVFRDGIGLKILLKTYGYDWGYNANGTDLIPLILEKFKHFSFCFIGTESPYIDNAVLISQQQGINVIGKMDGFQDFQTMQSFIEKNQPNILVLGMGMPKQELFALHLKQCYSHPLLIVNGGAIFDFISGRFDRAPAFYRNYGLEWFYRLANEPIRLFNRYVFGIPKFMMILWKYKMKERLN